MIAIVLAVGLAIEVARQHRKRRAQDRTIAQLREGLTNAQAACWEMGQAFETAVHQAISCERRRIWLAAYAAVLADQDEARLLLAEPVKEEAAHD